MSIRAMTWAWQISLSPTPKLLLMALADIADDTGLCWPSHTTLAAKCSLTDRTVRRVLVLLKRKSLILVEHRFKADGSRTSNRYRLAIDTPPDNMSGGSVTRGKGPGQQCPGATDRLVRVTTTESPDEPSPPPPEPDRTAGSDTTGGGRDLIYPKSLSKTQAEALGERLTGLTAEQAQWILDELSGRMAIARVNNPIGYCEALIKRLQQGQFSPQLAINVADARKAAAARQTAQSCIPPIEPGSSRRELPPALADPLRRMFAKSRG
jgi:Helix-turn-helix domain